MTIAIISALIAILIAVLLIASIRVRARFAEEEKAVSLSYTLLRVRLDFDDLTGRPIIAGFPLPKFSLRRGKKKAAEDKEEKAAKKKEKKKGKKRFKFSDLKIEYLSMAKSLIGGIRFRELELKIRGGFTEPFYTGKMYGYYWAARGMYPNLMSHVDFKPDFSSGSLKIEGKGLVYLRMFYIFRFVCSFLFEKLKDVVRDWFKIKKRGASYG
jgi:hypothetical protein